MNLFERIKFAWLVLIGRPYTYAYWLKGKVYIDGEIVEDPDKWVHVALVFDREEEARILK